MSISFEWKAEKRVAYVVFSGIPNMDLFRSIQSNLITLMNESKTSIHLIFDVRALDQFPPLIEFIRSPYITHPQKGQIVVIGLREKPLFRILVNSLAAGLRLTIQSADSLDEARDILQHVDSTLNWS